MADRYKPILYFSAGAASLFVVSSLYTIFHHSSAKTLPSPLDSHNNITAESKRRLPYPPIDFIPGARDLDTPYGLIRVYEWGPEDSTRRVLLIHGISGSCVALLSLAETLAAKGCRVMLPDLFGRGWSGGPQDLPYDGRLHASHLFMCLASSPIPWTGGRTFSIIGYSLGGAIVADFTSYFPDLIEDVILIAPGGLMKSDWKGRLLYSGLIPERLMKSIVTKRLQSSDHRATSPLYSLDPTWTEAEAAGQQTGQKSLAERISGIDGDSVVDWQLQFNAGFVPAFVSSIRFAPLRDRHDRWNIIGQRIAKEKTMALSKNFTSKSLLLILGRSDPIIRAAELIPEATKVLGAENLEIKIFEESGHEVGMSMGSDIGELLGKRWKMHE